MPIVYLDDEYLTVGSFTFGTPACSIDDYGPIWSFPTIKGDDFDPDGTDGITALARKYGAIVFTVPVLIDGEKNDNGVAYGNARDGLRQNLDALWTNVLAPVSASPWTRTVTHHLATGSTRSAAGIVLPATPTRRAGAAAVRLDCTFIIPGGSWTYTP